MFYRRKSYLIKKDFVETFNTHFNKTNLPNQIKYGSRLVSRWMKENDNDTVEIFAIWEYKSYEDYREIESKIQSDKVHLKRIKDWYEQNGGREYIRSEYILEMKNDFLESTVETD
ncbi:NIPSNAP family protein [Virgibacillus sp. DJP39]|uniref:NIPSNAP family protein n=1 Tax=Virgibacillus sp. DJP39 TaxID=3409790 RepID=UPI003BB5342C